MKVRFKTSVDMPVRHVFNRLNRELFEALRPPLTKMTLHRFDGTQLGDWVDISIVMPGMKGRWKSLVCERVDSDIESYFTDIGRVLPFPLKTWRHRHIVTQMYYGSQIQDEVTFTTFFFIFDLFMYPALKLFLAIRYPVYKRLFAKPK